METLQVPGDLIAAIRNIRRLDFSKQIGGITEREILFPQDPGLLVFKARIGTCIRVSIVSELDISGPAVSKM